MRRAPAPRTLQHRIAVPLPTDGAQRRTAIFASFFALAALSGCGGGDLARDGEVQRTVRIMKVWRCLDSGKEFNISANACQARGGVMVLVDAPVRRIAASGDAKEPVPEAKPSPPVATEVLPPPTKP